MCSINCALQDFDEEEKLGLKCVVYHIKKFISPYYDDLNYKYNELFNNCTFVCTRI